MGFLPPQFAKYESIAEAICIAFTGNCAMFDKPWNGFRVSQSNDQILAYYWQANLPGNWGELSLSPVPLARHLGTTSEFLEDWMAEQKLVNGDRECEKHKNWGVDEKPWPIISFANRAELEHFLQSYRALRSAANLGQLPPHGKAVVAQPAISAAAHKLAAFRAMVASGGAQTTREVVREERAGQDLLRPVVFEMWDNRCALTGVSHADLVVTSHIKPWSASSDDERLDPYNALPLAAHIDAAFDAGLVSFHDDGQIIVTDEMTQADRTALGLSHEACLRRPPVGGYRDYLQWHRTVIFRQSSQE